jgi:signal transduction histidine kinase
MPDAVNILLVDDEQRNLDALKAILDDPAYRLLEADDPQKALHLLLGNDVAAIVLDVKMPAMSGFELAQLIKGTKKFRQIPIVFLSAHLLDDHDIIAGYDAGAVDYLTKPVNPRILRHKVAVFADLFRKTRALAELNDTLESRVHERTAELERSEAALRGADKQKDEFIATLAHELRNPLAPLRTGIEILVGQPDPPPVVARTLKAMGRQLEHMVRLIDDLLDVSRITRGTLELRKEETRLKRVVEQAADTAAAESARRGQEIRVDAEDGIVAMVDATRVAQIVGNLLNNAAKHSSAGSPIRVELRQEGDSAVIRVIDAGVGIPAEQLGRVFDMFTKIERSTASKNEGLGIGLALSRKLAHLHGGELTGASAGEGRGATFTLTLPLEPTRKSGETVIDSVRPPPTTAPVAAPLRVVLVEDNEDSAEAMNIWLTMLGHRVRMAHDGPTGLAIILEERPDVVICDIGLPALDGVEVCRRVALAMSVPPFMIALTGWGMEKDRQRTLDAGFHKHLVKPVALDALRIALQSVGRKAEAG